MKIYDGVLCSSSDGELIMVLDSILIKYWNDHESILFSFM